ncbi:hypothetical protein LDENG_00209700 [Lucifuga dentata]|nr:hypothetical protein LDENG_00209700 [Lucifuga dentata]
MENGLGEILHCDEQLRSTLHCDNKEKLRRRLALLQKEYIRTVQRLQRAERLEAVRKHVRSRITQQNHQGQGGSEVLSNPCPNPSSPSLTLDAPGLSQYQAHTGDSTDSENSRSNQVIRFLLPSDDVCPVTSEPVDGPARDWRPSPALRLRSRRSRLRWERRRRSSEAGSSIENTEEVEEQREKMEQVRREGNEERSETEGIEIVNESEEVLSGSESESPSLLLTHWNTHGQAGAGEREGKEKQGEQEQTVRETELRDEGIKESVIHTEVGRQDGTQNGRETGEETERGEEDENDREGQTHGSLNEEISDKDTEQNGKLERNKIHDNSVEIREEKNEMVGAEHDRKSVGILDSCTLVEGLLFPAEYYVRTTRRMTFSQSQPDMQAIILTQLRGGRHGRGRGSRRQDRRTHTNTHSDQNTQTDTQAANPSAELPSSSQSSNEISASHTNMDACLSPEISTAHPVRGRRRKRGLGQASDASQLTNTMASPSNSLPGSNAPESCLISEEVTTVIEEPQPETSQTTDAQASAGDHRPESSPASGMSWQTLLLPCPPSSQTSLLPLPSLHLHPLLNNPINFDAQQDFHLPNDQFASLKLHKLRQVAAASGVEQFSPPSYNTLNSSRCADTYDCSFSDTAMLLPPSFSLTPTIANSPHTTEEKPAAIQSIDLQYLSASSHHTSHTHTSSSESVSVVQESDHTDQSEEQDSKDLHSQSCFKANDTRRPEEDFLNPQLDVNCPELPADQCAGKVNDYDYGHPKELQKEQPSIISTEKEAHCPDVSHHVEEQMSTNPQTEDKAVMVTHSCSDCSPKETPEKPSECYANSWAAAQTCNDTESLEECLAKHLNMKCPTKDFLSLAGNDSDPSTDLPTERFVENKKETCLQQHGVHSQLLLSSPLASAPCPFLTPHLLSYALPSSPPLPCLGLSPHPVPTILPLTSSPSAPSLTLPPPHSPSTQALSPPALSPCPSLTFLPPNLPPASLVGQVQTLCETATADQCHEVPAVSSVQPQGTSVERESGNDQVTTAEEHMRCTHTLKAPAGGRLVDACCLPESSGGLSVAVAGKWAVCVWSQTSTSKWSLIHTWTFNEPVINVFLVPDAAGLMYVTLGQLEIREVRMLSRSSLLQELLCEGVVQAVVGVAKCKVVTSSLSATSSTLQVFTLSEDSSAPSSRPLVSPGVCVGALAAVDGLPDALIGTDDAGRLFVWNLRTGQLLQRISLGDGLSHTACLRGYSYSGVLFVLLQHQLLNSLEEQEKEAKAKEDQLFSMDEKEKERTTNGLFSLVATNPLSGKSVLATRLYPPEAWSGRLCEADVSSSRVVGLSQSGCVCVWELGGQGGSRMVQAPESEGWQLARWGGHDILVTGHHNGDVTLHCYSTSLTPLSHQPCSRFLPNPSVTLHEDFKLASAARNC